MSGNPPYGSEEMARAVAVVFLSMTKNKVSKQTIDVISPSGKKLGVFNIELVIHPRDKDGMH